MLKMTELAISFDDISRAHERIAKVAYRTPVLTSRMADERAGGQLFFKCENQQRTGAFKFRGAYNALARLTAEQRARGVVAFSGGNHAQGVALAAQLLDMQAVIVMPQDAPSSKIEATRAYGSEILLYDRYRDDRVALGRQLADERGLTLIPSYDHADVMAGQGTLAKELFEQAGPLDMLIAPLGGGGMLSGCALAAKAMHPDCMVIGVEPAAGNDGQSSLRSGRIVHIDVPRTIADGAQAQHLGNLTFPVIQRHVDDILTVGDAELVGAMRFLFDRMKTVAEPTGCLALALAFSRQLDLKGKKVGIVISGGNIDAGRFGDLIRAASPL